VKLLYWLLMYAGTVIAFMLVGWAMPSGTLPGVVLGYLVLLFAALAVHELGHALAAMGVGVRLIHMGVGFLFIERRLRGVRVRLRSPVAGTSGSVMAIPDPSRSVRRQMLWICSAGPLANALAAALCLALGRPDLWTLKPLFMPWMDPGRALWLALGAFNGTLALCSLIPARVPLPTDGLQFLFWWRNAPEAQAYRRVIEACDQSLRGVTAAEVPPEEIDWFETCEDIRLRFFGRYIALRAAQERGDAAAFAAVLARCEGELENLPPKQRKALQQTWTLFQTEQAFERACQGAIDPPPATPALLRNLPPYLRCRLQAAQAWARGDQAGCRRAIEKAERDLSNTLDAAARKAEPLLLARLRQAPALAISEDAKSIAARA
jgi:hypothetical protein